MRKTRAITSGLTAVALLVHVLGGCCWHHGHSAMATSVDCDCDESHAAHGHDAESLAAAATSAHAQPGLPHHSHHCTGGRCLVLLPGTSGGAGAQISARPVLNLCCAAVLEMLPGAALRAAPVDAHAPSAGAVALHLDSLVLRI